MSLLQLQSSSSASAMIGSLSKDIYTTHIARAYHDYVVLHPSCIAGIINNPPGWSARSLGIQANRVLKWRAPTQQGSFLILADAGAT
eukprot:1194060-Prorocentrum_minimum.AAC.3